MYPELPHDSAIGHVTGRARFLEDQPRRAGELLVTFVGAPCAHGRLTKLDIGPALEIDGVISALTHLDIPGHNRFGSIWPDEPFLVEDEISYLGQPVAVIAAESSAALERARRAVVVEAEPLTPTLTIQEATAKESFIGPERWIRRGAFEPAFASAEHRLSGSFASNGQEQFYLESQAAIAYPGESGEVLVDSSTQNPTEIQAVVAEVLGLGQHQVVCRCLRMGGAFGGKETQATLPALMVCLVAMTSGRPARVIYSKDDDMLVTGKRHPYLTDYRVGFDSQGRILAAELDFRSDGGAFADLSTSVLERTMLHADNAYFLPNVTVRGRVCRTNLPPNTAFRGFGGPQAMAVIENIMEEISIRLSIDALTVRLANLYSVDEGSAGSTTHYGQAVTGNTLPELMERLIASSGYEERRSDVSRFNKKSGTHLRGLALTPVKFGISFTTKWLNQANALVNIFQDGSVQVSTGATEMGQGINTKLALLAAEELGIEASSVRVMPTSTEKNNNTSPTAASASTDLNGTAVVRACRVLRERLARLAAAQFAGAASSTATTAAAVHFEHGRVWLRHQPEAEISFADLASLARRERVDLGARGFYATPGVDFDRETGAGTPFYYFTNGAAVAQVLLDRLSGELKIEYFDGLLDIGRPMHLGIDRGQTIGGIVQGIGWVTTEELRYDQEGALLSVSPTTYKIPSITDLPEVFRVEFMENDLNRHNLRMSKAVGEPPLMLGLSVWAAIKNALAHIAPAEIPRLGLPATHEEILRVATQLQKKAIQASSHQAVR